MVYAYDQWAQLPVKDLYDSQLMLASVNAARDMYEKGLQKRVWRLCKPYTKRYGLVQSECNWKSTKRH